MNLKLSCTSLYGNNITSCLTIVVQGKRNCKYFIPYIPKCISLNCTSQNKHSLNQIEDFNAMFKTLLARLMQCLKLCQLVSP